MQDGTESTEQPPIGNLANYGTIQDAIDEPSGGQDDTHRGVDNNADVPDEIFGSARTASDFFAAYCFIFLNYCISSLQKQTISSLFPFVTSSFSAHSSIPAINIATEILSGVLKLPIARMVDIWGRPRGFVSMTVLATLGLALVPVCEDVKWYAAARMIYGVGSSGFVYVLDVVITDMSSIKNRALAFAFSESPYVATAFAGPALAQYFLQHSSWQMAFVFFSVVKPLAAALAYAAFPTSVANTEIPEDTSSGGGWFRSCWYVLTECRGR